MITVGWGPREPPLGVVGIMVEGASRALYAALLADRVDAFEDLRVVVGERYLIALSDSDALPWFEGAIWLGMDDGLLCPTTLAPDLPARLVRRAVCRGQKSAAVVVATPSMAALASPPARSPSAAMLRGLESPSQGLVE
ncbi:MAG: hypothetical protein R2733_17430 [Acidimicrobiales bacterium]